MRLASQAFIISISNLTVSLSTIVSSMILARFLSKDDYGTFKQVWLIYNTFAPILVLGIHTSVPYFVKEWHATKARSLLFMSGGLIAINSLIIAFPIYFAAEKIGVYFNNPDIAPLIKVFCLYPFFSLSISIKESYFTAIEKPLITSLMTLTTSLILLGTSTIPVLLGQGVPETINWIVIGAGIQFFSYLLLLLFFRSDTPLLPDREQIVNFSKMSLTVGLGYIILVFSGLMDKYFISWYYDTKTYAIYTNGAFQLPFIGIITTSIMSVLFPRLVELKNKGEFPTLMNLWNEAVRKVSLLMYPIVVFAYIMAEEIIVLIFSNAYIESATIFRIYLFLFLFKNINYSAIMLIFKDLRRYLYFSVAALTANFVGNIIFIKFYGSRGPAIATVLSTFVLIVAILWRNAKLLNVSLLKTLPYFTLIRILTIAVVSGIATEWSHHQYFPVISGVYAIGVCAIIYSGCYISLTLVTKTLEFKDFRFLKFGSGKDVK